MRRLVPARLAATALAAAAAFAVVHAIVPAVVPAGAQDKNPFDSGDDPGFPPPDAKDDSTPHYLKAVELQRKGKWKEAQDAFREIGKKYPNSIHKADCEMRGGDNCYMGTLKLHEGGPPARRIDVAVMGDGFQIDAKSQKQEEDWAKLCLDVLFSDASFSEYRNYFNYYYVRLVSKDDGVDEVLTDEQLKERQTRDKKKSKKNRRPTDFNTAIDCKAAGPQKQVMADRDLVYQWLDYANRDVPGCGDDALVIAFAKFGVLGMGGGGIANVGKPTNSVTVHEFGHAFVGLLDEYTNNPGAPNYAIRAPNATSDPKSIPWQHFLDKKVPNVGVFEGGATFVKGVWRPCLAGCSMNSAGATGGFCPVCREASVLRIYGYVDPIDQTSPIPDTERTCVEDDGATITVTPMQPMSHDLECEWTFERIQDSEPGPQPVKSDGTTTDGTPTMDGWEGWAGGPRANGRDTSLYELPPMGMPGESFARIEKGAKGRVEKFVFDVSKLPRGRYVVSARVSDPTPWVLKDKNHLLQEQASFWFTVQPKKK